MSHEHTARGAVERGAAAHGAAPRLSVLILLGASLSMTGGCASLTSSAMQSAMTGVGLVSFVTTGKGLVDHALDMATNKDCRILDGLLKASRRICEERGSAATAGDFHGVVAMLRQREEDRRLAAALDEPLTLRLAYNTGQQNPRSALPAGADTGPDRRGLRLAATLSPARLEQAGPASQ